MADLRCEKLSGIMAAQGLLVLLRESIAYRATGPARRRVIRQGKRLQCGLSPDPEPMSIASNHASRGKYAPRYWPTWVGIGFLWALTLLPYTWQIGIGRTFGALLYRLAKHRKHIARTNLALCFPELDQDQRESLLKKHFLSLGIGLMEIAMGWWMSDRRLKKLVHIEGLEHLHKALDKGKGVILLSAHFTTLEIGGRLLSLYTPFHVMYREHKNPAIESVMRGARVRFCGNVIDRRDLRTMLKTLKNNQAVWYAPDQDHGIRHGIFAPFFGVPAATTTATARIAEKSDAAIVPFFQVRLPGGGYRLTLSQPLENFPSGDMQTDITLVNHIYEQRIRENPDQYLWAHRRFKTRPTGKASVYDAPEAK